MMNEKFTSLLDVVEHTIEQHGSKSAAMDPKKSITWSELGMHARRIGNQIQSEVHAKEPGFPVAVFSEKSVELLEMILGVQYAGGFYCYLNPEQPKERLIKIMEVLQPKLCLVEDDLMERFLDMGLSTPCMSFSQGHMGNSIGAVDEIRPMIGRETPLYGVFTSGSTGVPKCVLVSHGAAMDFIRHFVAMFQFDETDIIANQAPFDFDVSIKDIVTAYYTGAQLVLIPRNLFTKPKELLDYLCDARVTSMTWAVSALCLISGLKGLEYRVPTRVRRVMFSGEVMPMKQLEIWQKYLPDALYVNLYGPSEITCNCTYFELQRTYGREEKLPLGRAFPGRKVFLLDEHDHPVTELHHPGEICVTGESLAIGYYHNEEETKKRFVSYINEEGQRVRMYRTGDLAELAEDGECYFAGRKDFQIKHMGHRIELEEIERSIQAIDAVERCVCRYDEIHHRISAFYVGSIDKKELHLILKEQLPVYMVPNQFIQVKAFVLNKNGKIDRKVLDELEVVA